MAAVSISPLELGYGYKDLEYNKEDMYKYLNQLGEIFIKNFHMFYLNRDNLSRAMYLYDMQSWWDCVKTYRYSGNLHHIKDITLYNEFLRAGSDNLSVYFCDGLEGCYYFLLISYMLENKDRQISDIINKSLGM